METGKFKHRKIWSTWCQMSASLFSSYLALRGHRNSPRHLRGTKVSLERNLRDPLVHFFSFSSWWGQALNHSEPRVLSYKVRSSMVTALPGKREEERTSKWLQTWKMCHLQAESDVLPHFPLSWRCHAPWLHFLSFLLPPDIITMTCPETLLPHNPIYSFISEHLLRTHASGTVLGTGAMS